MSSGHIFKASNRYLYDFCSGDSFENRTLKLLLNKIKKKNKEKWPKMANINSLKFESSLGRKKIFCL
jgi:hypothetical protein